MPFLSVGDGYQVFGMQGKGPPLLLIQGARGCPYPGGAAGPIFSAFGSTTPVWGGYGGPGISGTLVCMYDDQGHVPLKRLDFGERL